ncbi:UNVERIFIED_CONTAM: hypothetical protein HDU68_007052 [Siphonaria sp. JEL0065]|nr:hypothetical protein HDU68_007052 [Siphonaria sp. JEL0065]
MGLLASVCKLVAAQTILCELQPFTAPPGLLKANDVLYKGLPVLLQSFVDEDPSGMAINQLGIGIPFVFQSLFPYIVCTVLPGLIVLGVFICGGKDVQAQYVDRSKPVARR